MTYGISQKMPRWFTDQDSCRKPLGIAESPKTTKTLMLQAVVEEPRMEASHTKWRCRDEKETSSEDKNEDSKNTSNKDNARYSFASEKYNGGGKGRVVIEPWGIGLAADAVRGHEEGERTAEAEEEVARTP